MADANHGAVGLPDDEIQDLLRVAHAAAVLAYNPYSKVASGAALLTDDGQVFTGCSVECASIGLSICAERAAVVKAVSSGSQRFRAIVVATTHKEPSMPCGACRQFLAEFGLELAVIVQGAESPRVQTTLRELLPKPFTSADLG